MPAAGIDFEYCAVMQTETKSFTLVNSSNSLLQFEIVTDKDNTTFELEPQTGKLHHFLHNVWKLALIFFMLSKYRHAQSRAQARDQNPFQATRGQSHLIYSSFQISRRRENGVESSENEWYWQIPICEPVTWKNWFRITNSRKNPYQKHPASKPLISEIHIHNWTNKWWWQRQFILAQSNNWHNYAWWLQQNNCYLLTTNRWLILKHTLLHIDLGWKWAGLLGSGAGKRLWCLPLEQIHPLWWSLADFNY